MLPLRRAFTAALTLATLLGVARPTASAQQSPRSLLDQLAELEAIANTTATSDKSPDLALVLELLKDPLCEKGAGERCASTRFGVLSNGRYRLAPSAEVIHRAYLSTPHKRLSTMGLHADLGPGTGLVTSQAAVVE